MALGAAIALQGTLSGRKVRDEVNTRPNVYCLGVCPSGQGKERAAEFVGADVGLRDEIRRLVLEQLGAGTKPGGAKPAGANDLTDEVDIEDGAE